MILSKEFGVNPSCNCCFFCGKEKELILFGASYKNKAGKTAEAPRNVVLNYEPCDNCKSAMEKGFTLIEVAITPFENGQPAIQERNGKNPALYPSGKLWVLKMDKAKEIFQPEYIVSDRGYIDKESAFNLGLYDISENKGTG